jgi:hypothetical protein
MRTCRRYDTEERKMASRRSDHKGSSFARKFFIWSAVILITVWASRDPYQALAMVHAIATALGNAAGHHSTSSH